MGRLKDKLMALRPAGAAKRFLAVDFDSNQVRIVQAQRAGGQVKILQLTALDIPAGLDVSDARAVGEFLGASLQQLRLKDAAVVMSVPRGQAILKPIVLPPGTSAAEMPGMVRFQVEKQLPFAPQEAVIDFTIESHYAAEDGPQTPGIDVLGAAVRLPVVEHYRQIAISAALRLTGLGLRPYATTRFVRSCRDWQGQSPCQAVVNITPDEAEITVLEGESLAFSRSIVGRIAPARPAGAADIDEAVDTVVTEVVRSLQSYQARGLPREARVGRVLLAGGTGIEDCVAEALTRRLGVNCRRLDPAEQMSLGGPAARQASSFVSAIGLAMGVAAGEELPFDFINPKHPPVTRDRRKTLAVSAVAGAAVLVLAVSVAGAFHLSGKNARIDDLVRQANDLDARSRALADYEKRLKAVEDWTESACSWGDHFAHLSALFPSRADAYIDSLDTASDSRAVSFTLFARQREVIEDLAGRLTGAGYKISRDTVASRSDPKDPRYIFSVKMKVAIPPGMRLDAATLPASPAASRPGDERDEP